MNMKIKIKNKDNKLFVALVLIAALMMVSVAGVVMSDDARASSDVDLGIGPTSNQNPTSDTNVNYNIHITGGTVTGNTTDSTTITIKNTIKYNGTISFVTEQYGKLVPVHSVKFVDASSVVVTISATWTIAGGITASSMTITTYNAGATNNVTTGTINVMEGQAIFGIFGGVGTTVQHATNVTPTTGNKYFSGTVDGIAMVNIVRATIENDGNIILSGSVSPGNQNNGATTDKKLIQPGITVNGDIEHGSLTVTSTTDAAGTTAGTTDAAKAAQKRGALTLTIAEDASVTTSNPLITTSLAITVSDDTITATATQTHIYYAQAIPVGGGTEVKGAPTALGLTTATVTFTGLDISKEYDVIIAYTATSAAIAADTDVVIKYQFERVSFNSKGVPSSKNIPGLVTGTDGGTTALTAGEIGDGTVSTNNFTLDYYSAKDTISRAIAMPVTLDNAAATNKVGVLNGTIGTAVGNETAITFDTSAPVNDANFSVILIGSSNDKPFVYVGRVNGEDATAELTDATKVNRGGSTKPFYTLNATATLAIGGVQTIDIAANSKMSVVGELNITKNVDDTTNGGSITADGTINVTGIINYKDTSAPNINGINAARYSDTKNDIFYYTTLVKAMAASSDITVLGTLVVKEDIELKGNSSATTIANKITIDSGANLEIGVVAVVATATTPAVEGITAVVTVPTTTALTINGEITVTNGQLKWTVTGTPSPDDDVKASVFMIEDKTGVYTDVTTALSLAASGSELTLREITDSGGDPIAARISTVAEVKTGVTLDTDGNPLAIAKDGKLTVNGVFESTGNFVIARGGEFIINSKDVTISTITLVGTFTINADIEFISGVIITIPDEVVGTNTDLSVITSETNPAIINVNGTFSNSNATDGFVDTDNYVDINITGKYINSVAFVTGATNHVDVNVSGAGELNSVAAFIRNLTVTDTGKVVCSTISGIITVEKSAYIGNANSTDAIAGANGTDVTITLAAAAYAVVYGTTAKDVDVSAVTPGFDATTQIIFGTDALYATVYAGSNAVLISTISNDPVLTGYVFNGYYTTADHSGTKIDLADADSKIGAPAYSKIYANMDVKKFTVSFQYEEGVKWLFDGVEVSIVAGSEKEADYGQHFVSFAFADGYSGDVKLTIDGQTYTAGKEFLLDSDTVFAADGAHKTIPGDSMDMIEILLIVITIVFVIVAIVVIMRLMRS